ncbi:hypothetical protein DPMN_021447 [Dreissena polymorpha]|uniref:Uncharacterized protein n=1 Tax=Dreissena polymorpha TaxID=45954 RepID=A0A9D4NKS7_DREPO|nr:hypothetical protein DPMN_021447 [Dreissena polymorpha]
MVFGHQEFLGSKFMLRLSQECPKDNTYQFHSQHVLVPLTTRTGSTHNTYWFHSGIGTGMSQ